MHILAKPDAVDTDILPNLGPLAALAGVWEGDQGIDVSPTPAGSEETRYRERIVFEPMGPVVNGPQVLYGLRYATTAWPLGEDDAFHEEVGYWLWDPERKLVMRCFMVPRAVLVSAGAVVEPDARQYTMTAECGDKALGVLSNPFLAEFTNTDRYECTITVHDDGSFSYQEDTVLRIHGQDEQFHHTDENRLQRVSGA